MTGSNKTGCSVLWLCWYQQSNAQNQLALFCERIPSESAVTHSTIPCPLDSCTQKHLRQKQSLLPILLSMMDVTEETLWSSRLPHAPGPQLHKLRGPGKHPASRLSPRLKHPSWSMLSLNQLKGKKQAFSRLVSPASHCFAASFRSGDPKRHTGQEVNLK